MSIVWCDPPEARGSVWSELLEPVVERPGEWGMVRDFLKPARAAQAAKDLRMGRVGTRRPPGRWEFRSGRIARGVDRWGVWARWLGP